MKGEPFIGPPSSLLDREQALEERTVTLQRNAEVLGGDVVAAIPLLLEFGAFLGKDFGKALHGGGDEAVGLFDGFARFVDESGLHFAPAISQALKFVIWE